MTYPTFKIVDDKTYTSMNFPGTSYKDCEHCVGWNKSRDDYGDLCRELRIEDLFGGYCRDIVWTEINDATPIYSVNQIREAGNQCGIAGATMVHLIDKLNQIPNDPDYQKYLELKARYEK